MQRSLLSTEDEVINALEKQYAKSLAEIGRKIKAFQSDIEMLDESLTDTGISAEERSRLISMKQSKIYQKQYQEALEKQIGGILDKMQSDNYSTLDAYMKQCYEDGYLGTMYDLSNQGIPVIMPINQASIVKAVLTDSPISQGLYNRLGVHVGNLKKNIASEISRGIATGLTYSQIARNISNLSGAPLSRTKTIARTEGHRIQISATRDAQYNAREKGADLVKIWDATLDGKTRESHVAIDGEIRELDEKFSNGMEFPSDPSGGAAEVCNCRCQLLSSPRWAIKGGFTKMDNFTKQLREFETPEDYAEFKEWYFSKENKDYMEYFQKLEDKYGTRNYKKLYETMSQKEYDHLQALEDASPMWKREQLRNNLPKSFKDTRNVGKPISADQLDAIIKKAEAKGVKIGTIDNPTGNFQYYCGDIEVLESVIDEIEKQQKTSLFKKSKAKKVILKYDNVLGYEGNNGVIDIGAFAETQGNTIILNKFMFDDSKFLMIQLKEAIQKKMFVGNELSNATTVIDHEIGHIIDKHSKGLYNRILDVIEKEANKQNVSIESYLAENISTYSKTIDDNDIFTELVAEINSLLQIKPDSNIIELIREEGVIK